MIDIKNRVIQAAEDRGLSASRPVLVALNNSNTSFRDIRFVVSHSEPSDVATPLNVLWVVQDPASVDFGKVLRRSSRSSSNGYEHSWSEVSSESGLYITQIWDMPEPEHQTLYDHAALIGNPHSMIATDLDAVVKSGDKLTGSLEPRTLESGEQYLNEEVFPRSFLEQSLLPLRQLTSQLKMFFTNLNNQFTSLRNRTNVLETNATSMGERVTAVETAVGESGIAAGYAHVQEEPAEVWTVPHNLNSMEVLVQVFQNNQVVWPASIQSVDENTVSVTFAIPIIGTARILPIA